MIVSCPSCATRYDLPDTHIAEDGMLMRCPSCQHSWLESNAADITIIKHQRNDIVLHESADFITSDFDDESYDNGQTNNDDSEYVHGWLNPIYDEDDDPFAIMGSDHSAREIEDEARRLTQIARDTARVEEQRKAERRSKTRKWSSLAACIAIPLCLAILFPEQVVQAAPAASNLYSTVGLKVETQKFNIINLKQEYLVNDNVRVLAIRGQVINKTQDSHIVPPLKFTLHDKNGKQVYTWILKGDNQRLLQSGNATSFVTRLAEPPLSAKKLEIRFAPKGKIG